MTPTAPHPASSRPLALALLVATTQLWAQSPAPAPSSALPASAPAASDEAIVLSPFTVQVDTEKGYHATQTLNGTRLKTDLRDIGSALTIFTEQMMNDLGANSINDILNFAPNTDSFTINIGSVDGNGNDFINLGTQYVTRGGATSIVGQNFFSSGVVTDRYNAEAFTFTRGPNAILFGLGNPAGAFVSSTKRAKVNRSESLVEFRTDDNDSLRFMVDHNQVLKKGLAAIRYSGLHERTPGFRIPSESYQRRHFVTATLTPFKRTNLRANYEQGYTKFPAIRPWPVYDGVSTWAAAGSPLLATFTNTAAKPAGIVNNTSTNLISTFLSPGGVQVPPLSWLNTGLTPNADYPNFPAVNTRRSLINPGLYPTFATAHGLASYRVSDFKITSVFLEQQLTQDLFLEVGYNFADNRVKAVNGFVGQDDILRVDVNKQLPNGQPNPNVGRLYTQSRPTLITAPGDATSKRAMASYEFDFAKKTKGWLRDLGRHRAASFVEQVERFGYSTNNGISNVTPLPGAPPAITNAANIIVYRYYYDVPAGKVGNRADQFNSFPVLNANDPLPPADPSGVTPAFVNSQGINFTESTVKTRAFALQSTFLKDRVIVTYGQRNDKQAAYRGSPNDYLSVRDARLVHADPATLNLRSFVPNSLRQRGGDTETRGLVFHATHWVSFAYNDSTNFQVNDSTRAVDGELLPNPQGTGSDYSIKFALFDRRLFFDLTYYKNAAVNRLDGGVSNSVAGDLKGNLDAIWNTVASFTNDAKYRDFPYSTTGTVWSDNADVSSSGWEFSATANPSNQLRFTVNGSKRSTITTSDRGLNALRYVERVLPVIESHPEWLPLNATNNLSVAQRVAQIKDITTNFRAIQGVPADIYAPAWSVNLISSYDFARATRLLGVPLAGLSVGANMNMRGPTIDGFAETSSAAILNPNAPYYASRYEIFGGMIGYSRKIFSQRLDWRLQLNVRNVFDAYTVRVLRTVDARDGTHRGVNAIYHLTEPRTYQLTSTFKF